MKEYQQTNKQKEEKKTLRSVSSQFQQIIADDRVEKGVQNSQKVKRHRGDRPIVEVRI